MEKIIEWRGKWFIVCIDIGRCNYSKLNEVIVVKVFDKFVKYYMKVKF